MRRDGKASKLLQWSNLSVERRELAASDRESIVAFNALRYFTGRWKLRRTIEPGGAFTGTAQFILRDDNFIDYREEGALQLENGDLLNAARSYVYRAEPTGFSVFFNEKPLRLFHRVDLHEKDGALRGEARHQCGEDLYVTHYRLENEGFTIRHRVAGPRKSYTSLSCYQKMARENE